MAIRKYHAQQKADRLANKPSSEHMFVVGNFVPSANTTGRTIQKL
jgi:hypothetical protein